MIIFNDYIEFGKFYDDENQYFMFIFNFSFYDQL